LIIIIDEGGDLANFACSSTNIFFNESVDQPEDDGKQFYLKLTFTNETFQTPYNKMLFIVYYRITNYDDKCIILLTFLFDLRGAPCGKQIPIKNQKPSEYYSYKNKKHIFLLKLYQYSADVAGPAIAPIEYANCFVNGNTYTQLR